MLTMASFQLGCIICSHTCCSGTVNDKGNIILGLCEGFSNRVWLWYVATVEDISCCWYLVETCVFEEVLHLRYLSLFVMAVEELLTPGHTQDMSVSFVGKST